MLSCGQRERETRCVQAAAGCFCRLQVRSLTGWSRAALGRRCATRSAEAWLTHAQRMMEHQYAMMEPPRAGEAVREFWREVPHHPHTPHSPSADDVVFTYLSVPIVAIQSYSELTIAAARQNQLAAPHRAALQRPLGAWLAAGGTFWAGQSGAMASSKMLLIVALLGVGESCVCCALTRRQRGRTAMVYAAELAAHYSRVSKGQRAQERLCTRRML